MNIWEVLFGFFLAFPAIVIILAIMEIIKVRRERFTYELKREIMTETIEMVIEIFKNRKD